MDGPSTTTELEKFVMSIAHGETKGNVVPFIGNGGDNDRASRAAPDGDAPYDDRTIGAEPQDKWTVQRLLDLLGELSVFHSPSGDAYCSMVHDGARQTLALPSSAFRAVVRSRAFAVDRDLPARHVLDGVVDVLSAHARALEMPVYVRVGGHAGSVYVDLGDQTWRAIEIDADGYRIVESPPIYFKRPDGIRALPEPQSGGSLYDLLPLVTVDPDDFDLLIVFLLGTFMPDGPFPVLNLSGDAGSGKTSLSRMVRELVDPNGAALRSEPREPRDIQIAASNSWLVALDNLSSMPKAVADSICRVTSGVGASYHKNYTDGEEVLFDACRPVLVNGIDDLDNRHDLRDRMLSVRCLPIPDQQRRREADILDKFRAMRPTLLGALCEATCHALANSDAVAASHPALPRLADLAVHAEAAREALGWEEGKAIALLTDHGVAARQRFLAAAPIAQAVVALAQAGGQFAPWTGTASELEQELRQRGAKPPGAATLSKELNRLAPTLRDAGVTIERDRVGHAGSRTITITLTPQTTAA